MRHPLLVIVCVTFGCSTRPAVAQEITVATARPVVVKTTPEAASTGVDPDLKQIEVKFSKKMADQSWSAVRVSPDTFPKIDGKLRYEPDGRTWILPVALEPGRTYAMWLNTERFANFKDRDGRSAVPYLLVFETEGDGTAQKPAPAATRKRLAAAFDALWEGMAAHYSYFALKRIDWPAWKAKHRGALVEAESADAFIDGLVAALAELRDGHVWIEHSDRQRATWKMEKRPHNVNLPATLAALEEPQTCGQFAVVGLTQPDRFAAVVLLRQSAAHEAAVEQVVEFLRAHHDALGCLLDLRTANGGNELLAQRIASQFALEETVFARSRYRAGPNPDDFGPTYSRTLAASEQPFEKPVVCLIGSGCVSGAEGFALMMQALPQVTLVGEPTRGSSGNPQPFALPGLDAAVWYSRWVALTPDGTPIEDRGVLPDVRLNFPRSAYRNSDPTWNKAVEVLRERVEKTEAVAR